MELALLYLWLKLDSISFTITLLSVIGLLVGTIGLLVGTIGRDGVHETFGYGDDAQSNPIYVRYVKWQMCAIKGVVASIVLIVFANVVIPTKKEAAVMAGAYVVREVVTNDRVKAIASRSVQIIETYLDEYLKGLEPKQAEKK